MPDFSSLSATLDQLIPRTARSLRKSLGATAAPRLLVSSGSAAPALHIDIRQTTVETSERGHLHDQGQYLARQEKWAELGELIRLLDQHRARIPSGRPASEIMSLGARADMSRAACASIARGDTLVVDALMTDLHAILDEHSCDHGLAQVVAMMHVDIGWAWRGEGWSQDIPPDRRGAFHAHFRQAARILDGFSAFELDAPMLAAARCALLPAEADPKRRIVDDYDDLIEMDNANPFALRSLGVHLLPRWFGSYDQVRDTATEMAHRLQEDWGTGGYAWVWFDALALDPEAFAWLDARAYIRGLRDILAHQGNQHMVNLIAAHLAVTHANARSIAPPADLTRRHVCTLLDAVLRDHLQEVHPLIWAAAADPFGQHPTLANMGSVLKQGQALALSVLGQHFARDLEAGRVVRFDREGLSIAAGAGG